MLINVQKEYQHRQTNGHRVLRGTIDIECETYEAGAAIVEGMMAAQPPLSTIDPRIEWENFDAGSGWDYIDWTFVVLADDGLEFGAAEFLARLDRENAARKQRVAALKGRRS